MKIIKVLSIENLGGKTSMHLIDSLIKYLIHVVDLETSVSIVGGSLVSSPIQGVCVGK